MLSFILIFLAISLICFFSFIFFKASKSVQSKKYSPSAENLNYNPSSYSDHHKISDDYSSNDSADGGGGGD